MVVAAAKEGRRLLEREPRTVDHHVSAILRKLDVQSRGRAVAEAGRLGRLDDPQAVAPI